MSTPLHPGTWLSARRIRIHGLLLAVCMWAIYAVDMSAPGLLDRSGLVKGTDFVNFYTLGTIALRHQGSLLFDRMGQAALSAELVPQAWGYAYVPLYAPHVSMLLAPFALLPYSWALVVWLAMNAVVYAACCVAIWRRCPKLQRNGWTVAILALAFPGFFHLIAWGQTSGFPLVTFTLAYLGLRSRRSFLAGLAIGCLLIKPQLGIAAAVLFVVVGQFKVIAGALAAVAIQLASGWMYYGTAAMQDYARALLHTNDVIALMIQRPYQMFSLRAFWYLLLPGDRAVNAAYFACAIAVLAVLVLCWRKNCSLELKYVVFLLASVLTAPHLYVYDLVVLAPAFLLLADWAAGAHTNPRIPSIRLLAYGTWLSFLLGPLYRILHIQISVILMVLLLWTIYRACTEAPNPSPAEALPV